MSICRLASIVLLAAVALAPAVASAQSSAADRAVARTLTLEGYDALDNKDWATAADRFTRADTLYHVPSVALGLARAQVGLGRLVDAQDTYRRMVQEGAPPGSPPAFVQAVEDARKDLAALIPRVPSVVITVTGSREATVTIDDVPVPSAAFGVKRPVDPGKHVIRATAPGFLASTVRVTIGEGKSEAVAIELRSATVAPEIAPPVAPPVGIKPALPIGPQAGPNAAPRTEKPPERAPAPAWPAQKIAGVAVAGASAIGFVVGGVLAGKASSQHDDLAKSCPDPKACDPKLAPDIAAYHATSTGSLAGFIAGGALLATGIVVIVTVSKARLNAGAARWISPRIGAGYVGVEGRF
jgi:hypothetical protein